MKLNNKVIFLIKVIANCLLLLFLNCRVSFSQSNVSIKWARFNLLAVDTTWKYKSGTAKPEYFTKSFNDTGWQTVSNSFVDKVGVKDADWMGIGVFRKKFSLPDSLKGRKFEIFLGVIGASEIYLDGKQVNSFGKVTAPEKNEVMLQKSVPVELDSSSIHELAVYFSNQITPHVMVLYGLMGYGIQLSPVNPDDSSHDNDYLYHFIFSLGIILSFCLFFCVVYAFYPNRLASLMSALMLAVFSLIFIGGGLRDFSANHDLSRFIVGEEIWEIGFSCCYGFYLLYLFSIYYKKLPWRSLIVIGLMLISLVLIFTMSFQWFNITRIFLLIYLIEAWRILILGIRKKRTGFWIIAAGLFLSNAGTLFVILDVFHFFPWYLNITQHVLGVATDLSFPLTLALQFALEFGSANRDLKKQLVHVNELSKKTLDQEKEKQQILATQNETLDLQVTQRTAELNNSLNELKSTQAQLIQSEKMASLGELTAGIAHEIQNPLNFVNNFSEVNNELIDELKEELATGNQQLAMEIADDIKENEQKINHHGRRADAIVKGMLQHSRKSEGKKELTDINALCDEYLRLSYHGFRAKEKSFNIDFKTDFDDTIGKINIVRQDIGRVLLNLFNNAFYAVNEKQNACQAEPVEAHYQPTVIVTTKKLTDNIEISVEDNGNGIPQNIIDKIFQPFFTTKPTGQGTGLGLSLAYDIVKAHGGELSHETNDGNGATFNIRLSLKS